MSAAPVLMRAQPGGQAASTTSPLTVTKAARDLHIPAVVLGLTGLTLTARMVLAEVLDLHRVNGKVWANDQHFANRLGCGVRSIGDAIAKLEEAGYLLRPIDPKARQKRILVPVEKWLQNPQGLPAESATTPCKNCNDSLQNLQGVPAKSADINTILNTSGNTTLKNTPPSTDASAARPEKKREEFPAELPADGQQLVPPVARPPRAKPARAGDPEHFAAFWQAWPRREARADAVKAFAKLSPEDQAAAASRADSWLTARPDLADPARYRFIPHATTWLNQERWTDAVPAQTATSHVNSPANPTSTPPRPVGGQKPTGDAAHVVAEGLMRRRFAKPVGH